MKKLLKNLAILTVFAFGLFTGCNNDAEEIDLNVNVTVSTDTPSLDEPKPLAYGVLLTWRATQDSNVFRVTRQAKGGEEKILYSKVYGNRCIDGVGFNNVLEEGVEYTYRVYNLGGEEYYTDNGVVKFSYAEKKITLAAGSLKKQGEKLDLVNKDDVKTSFKNSYLKINFLNDENCVWNREVVVRDAETGRKVAEDDEVYSYFERTISAQKVNVEIKNVSYDGYYADSDVVTIENIENTVAKEVSISDLKATLRDDKTVVLLWTTEEKVEASEFTIQRSECTIEYEYDSEYGDYRFIYVPIKTKKPEVLKITPVYEEKYDGTYYWKAIDESVEVGTNYKYEVITDYNSCDADVPVPGNIEITDVVYSNVDNAVILTWKAQDVSDFKIYRAEEDLYHRDESQYYDLYKPINIQAEKVDTLDDGYIVYTAKDTTVEKDKDYTYRITSTDGLDCSFNWAVSTGSTPDVSRYISLDVSVNGYPSSYISNKTDKLLLSFDYGDKNATYKGYYTTVDNKGNESAREPFDFTKDNDTHYRKTFEASTIKNLDKAVSVKFYIKAYDGDKLLKLEWGEYNDDGYWINKSDYEYTKTLRVDPSVTTYTSLSSISASQVYDNQSSSYKKEITITAYGYNFDKVIKVTYFKDDGEVKTPKSTLTWTKVTGYDNRYTTTLSVDEYGNYTICATIPEDNAYSSASYDLSKTTPANVYNY